MVVYDFENSRIRLRQSSGDEFRFAVVLHADGTRLRLCEPPRWANGVEPPNAELRVCLAFADAQCVARRAGMVV